MNAVDFYQIKKLVKEKADLLISKLNAIKTNSDKISEINDGIKNENLLADNYTHIRVTNKQNNGSNVVIRSTTKLYTEQVALSLIFPENLFTNSTVANVDVEFLYDDENGTPHVISKIIASTCGRSSDYIVTQSFTIRMTLLKYVTTNKDPEISQFPYPINSSMMYQRNATDIGAYKEPAILMNGGRVKINYGVNNTSEFYNYLIPVAVIVPDDVIGKYDIYVRISNLRFTNNSSDAAETGPSTTLYDLISNSACHFIGFTQ